VKNAEEMKDDFRIEGLSGCRFKSGGSADSFRLALDLLPPQEIMQELYEKGVVTRPPTGQKEIVEYYAARARGKRQANPVVEVSAKDLVAIGNLVFKRTQLGPLVAAEMFIDVTEREDLKGDEKGRDIALYSLAEMWRTGFALPGFPPACYRSLRVDLMY